VVRPAAGGRKRRQATVTIVTGSGRGRRAAR
jgi:hypothetical protein